VPPDRIFLRERKLGEVAKENGGRGGKGTTTANILSPIKGHATSRIRKKIKIEGGRECQGVPLDLKQEHSVSGGGRED